MRSYVQREPLVRSPVARRKVGDGGTRRLPGRPVVAGYGADPEGRCPRCWLQPRVCICARLAVLASPVPIVVVRHYKESLKSSNSARLLPLVLSGARIVDVSRPDPNRLESASPGTLEHVDLPPDAALLYPSHHREDTDESDAEVGASTASREPLDARRSLGQANPRALVVPDGTWAQTRRLVRRVEPLPRLPRFGVDAPQGYAAPPRLLTPHEPWAVSTIEAIGFALMGLGYGAEGAALLDAYRLFVEGAAAQGRAPVVTA